MHRDRIVGVVAMLLVSGVALVGATRAGATAPGTNGRIAYSRFDGSKIAFERDHER
jgi:hypothetical protein